LYLEHSQSVPAVFFHNSLVKHIESNNENAQIQQTNVTLLNAPGDYHLFGPMKKLLGVQKFASDADVNQLISVALTAAGIFFASGIQKLVARWDKCLNDFGQYVEK